ncbi:MAG: hypothetical protein IKE55_11730 [Kiritimatiellae bacterium]|nr:hypothetical protein [Kiritimatiellia bacterium]
MKERLYSLDVLRGLDMILLVVIGPIVNAANRVWHFPAAFMGQFKHGWECFTLWDFGEGPQWNFIFGGKICDFAQLSDLQR